MGIPARRRTRANRHIDTQLFRALVDQEDDPDLCRCMMHLSNDQRVNLAVSMLVVGEGFSGIGKLTAERCARAASEWSRLTRGGKIRVFGLGKRAEVTDLASRLMGADTRLRPVDATILAGALEEPTCGYLYTTDHVMLESLRLQTIAKEYGTKVREPPGLRG